MTVRQQAVREDEFAPYLRDLVARLDPGRGWYGVFTRRDPVGMRSCLDGEEIPPWDVVESLLADLAALHGAHVAERVSVRAATLHSASAAARDRRPGGRQELVRRLELMLREQARAAERLGGAGTATGPDRDGPEALAWARDDHERASARCVELRGRLTALTARGTTAPAERTSGTHASGGVFDVYAEPAAASTPAPAPVRKKPRGARFAGLETDDGPGAAVPVPDPLPPVPTPSAAPAPRGARFGGGRGEAGRPASGRGRGPDPVPDPAAEQAVAAAVGRLLRLRAEGRSGEAHGVLCEVAAWPAPRLPVLAVALCRAGLAADWRTLLWEVSSLPPAAFAAAAGALAAAGRDEDCGQLLRQGVARPAGEVGDAALCLDGAGREREALDLLGAFVRVRTPQEAAALAVSAWGPAAGGTSGARLVALLLAAAREVSAERARDLVHALRVAGVPGV
ncbi:hypothetical protein [Streptomyces sp. NPDC101181]|uniref:hypothetical protein n=1 Tax=Streptomyces sp. NPDC101181 TaxID=3366125 RepID=UPI003819510C